MNKQITMTIFLGAIAISFLLLGQPAAVSAQLVETVPVYRFNNRYAGHYYSLKPGAVWAGDQNEGISFYLSPLALPYLVPLFALEGPGATPQYRDHLYTPDLSERATCLNSGYLDRGIMGYVLPAELDLPGTAPLHRWRGFYRPDPQASVSLDHLYAATKPDVPRYTYEGEAARIWTAHVSLPYRLVELVAPAAGSTIAVGSKPVLTWRIWSNGGSIRLSYSNDNGQSWRPITSIVNDGTYDQMNNQSYTGWTIPPEAAGKIVIKADFIRSDQSGPQRPWATHSSGPITVRNSRIVPPLRKP